MASTRKWAMLCLVTSAAAVGVGCSKEEENKPAPSVVKSAKPQELPSATPTLAPSVATPPPPAAAAEPSPDCPKGSTGEGTMSNPCEGKGATRLMEVSWTGKYDDKGPQFRVVNKSESTILYGKIAVYFYDKAGKQIEVEDKNASPPKAKPFHTCSGNLFAGIMKPAEKATITFSCVKKEHVPENATAIEGEMQMVGFADDTEKRSKLYWRNNDLTPEARKKGGIKK
jgi:hypothetical protein